MLKRINCTDFIKEFDKYNRSNNFSYFGREALFNYFEESDTRMELDIISICCDYSEYRDFKELKKEYDVNTLEELREKTRVIEFEGGLIIRVY
jgi:hypothetical protein